ncbi:MAG: hypothetical protein SGPRY_001741, partial [Prymnesium sp.]
WLRDSKVSEDCPSEFPHRWARSDEFRDVSPFQAGPPALVPCNEGLIALPVMRRKKLLRTLRERVVPYSALAANDAEVDRREVQAASEKQLAYRDCVEENVPHVVHRDLDDEAHALRWMPRVRVCAPARHALSIFWPDVITPLLFVCKLASFVNLSEEGDLLPAGAEGEVRLPQDHTPEGGLPVLVRHAPVAQLELAALGHLQEPFLLVSRFIEFLFPQPTKYGKVEAPMAGLVMWRRSVYSRAAAASAAAGLLREPRGPPPAAVPLREGGWSELLSARGWLSPDVASADEESQKAAVVALSAALTFPVTSAYVWSTLGLSSSAANICVVGARAEASLPAVIWREFPELASLSARIEMAGPSAKGKSDVLSEPGRGQSNDHGSGASMQAILPDIFVLFNPGLGEPGWEQAWGSTVAALQQAQRPIAMTALSWADAKRDAEFCMELAAMLC